MAPPDFNKNTRETLAKRANYICSNPECRTITSAPAKSSPTKAIIIGEAAHIFGAREKTARFQEDMSDTARASITNGIWLCKNCHKSADDDEASFSADLMFKWQSIHEAFVFEQLGKQNDSLRRRLLDEELTSFGKIPEHAKRIIRDKPEGWEFRLISELLPFHLSDAERRWDELSRGLYTNALSHTEPTQFIPWMIARNEEILQTIETLKALISELQNSWGPPGESGDAKKINRACELFGRVANRMVDWEEDVKFMLAPEPFERISSCLAGAGGHNIKELGKIKFTMDKIIEFVDSGSDKKQSFEHELIIDLPDDWEPILSAEIKKAQDRYVLMIESGEL